MLPKTGIVLSGERAARVEMEQFADRIRQALRAELGGTRAAAKSIMRWTGVSDRTARNWLIGAASPSGYHLMCLARESDGVLGALLFQAGRKGLALSLDLHAVELALAKANDALAALKGHDDRSASA